LFEERFEIVDGAAQAVAQAGGRLPAEFGARQAGIGPPLAWIVLGQRARTPTSRMNRSDR